MPRGDLPRRDARQAVTARDGRIHGKADGAMPDAVTTPSTEPASAPPAAATSAPVEPKTAPAEAISDDLGESGKAALQKEREARQALARELAEAKSLQQQFADKVKEFEDRDKSETEKLNDQLARLQKQLTDKDAEVAAAKVASLRAEVAADKHVPAGRLHGTTREELEADADAYLAEVAANTANKRPPKAPTPSSGLKSGASPTSDTATDPKARAVAAMRAMRAGA